MDLHPPAYSSKCSMLTVQMACCLALCACLLAWPAFSQESARPDEKPTYANHAKSIRILPGQWRPHYPWEHIAWVSPSWPSQDYLWLDIPEAIFTDQGLLYLSHVNPPFPTLFGELPAVPWEEIEGGIAFERTLPNGVRFGTHVTRASDTEVELRIHIHNGSSAPLTGITLQTCAYLRGIEEFAEYTTTNKFVHTPKEGWITVRQANGMEGGDAPYRVGWRRGGKPLADLPGILTTSSRGERLVAMTWFKDSLSMVSNPNHPCMHADPQFPDIPPGQAASVHGKLIFFEGKPENFPMEKLTTP